jgi:phenazine biosynthesis protein PhzF family
MSFYVHHVNVFASTPDGGSPTPVVADASSMSDAEMQAVAKQNGHECVFVLPPKADSGCDLHLRFWVPNQEMNMCGHATVGAVWLLHKLELLAQKSLRIATKSGIVEAAVSRENGTITVEISQPCGTVEVVPNSFHAAICDVLGITGKDLLDLPFQNAGTSRVKTLVPLKSVALLDGLQPDFSRMKSLCEDLDCTGLYPYAIEDEKAAIFHARQFPKSSGFPEDPATGIAATALLFGLRAIGLVDANEGSITVYQGRAMGCASKISARLRKGEDGKVQGCWFGGSVQMDNKHHP